jgi:hypothetical protein
MGLVGAGLVVVPLVTLHGFAMAAGLPLVVLGAVLLVLCAFHPRIDGPLRFRGFQIPIAGEEPADHEQQIADASEDASEPPADEQRLQRARHRIHTRG